MSYDPVPPFRRDFDAARDPYTARNALGITTLGGGGGGAPDSAEYITAATDATLTNERVLTNTATVTWDFATAGQAKANVAVSYQPLDATLTALAAYNTNGLLTQTAADTFTGRTLTGPAAGITVSNGDGVAGNPTLALADDLAALEGLAGTNTIYYRSGASAWSAVTVGTGLSFSSGTLSATSSGAATTPTFGRLTYASATALKFAPFLGNKIQINGTQYTIPNAGIAGTANTGIVVNGTGSSSLAANTTYYVYAFDNSGTVTADFRTDGNGHITDTTSGNEGVEVRCSSGTTPDPTRTLIGLIRTNASSQFADVSYARHVRSWFNRGNKLLDFGSVVAATTTATTPIATPMNGTFVLWSDDVVNMLFSGFSTNTSIAANYIYIYLDGAQVSLVNHSIPGVSYTTDCTIGYTGAPAEGFHTLTVYVNTAAGTLGLTGQFTGRL